MNPDQRDIVERYVPLANRLADGYAGKGLDLEDLRQEAYLGLCDAAEQHDPVEHPDTFSTYAKSWCKKRIVAAIALSAVVHGPERYERDRTAGHFLRSPIPIDQYGFMPLDDGGELAEHVAAALDECTDRGRCVLTLVRGLQGPEMTIAAVAHKLGMSLAQARAHHDGACRTIAATFREHGWPVA